MAIQTTLTWVRQDDGTFAQEVDVERIDDQPPAPTSVDNEWEHELKRLRVLVDELAEHDDPSYPSELMGSFSTSDVDDIIDDEDQPACDRLGAVILKIRYLEEDSYRIRTWSWDINGWGPDTDWEDIAREQAYNEGCSEDHLCWWFVDWGQAGQNIREDHIEVQVMGQDVYFSDC